MEDGHQLGPGGGAVGGEGVLAHAFHEAGFLGVLDRTVEPVLLVHVLEGHQGVGVFRVLLQGKGVKADHLAVWVAGIKVVAVHQALVGVAVIGGLQNIHAAVGLKAVPKVGVGVEDHVHVILLQQGLHAVGQVVLGQGVVVDGHLLPR